MAWMKFRSISAGRGLALHGLDFSIIEGLDPTCSVQGSAIKFLGTYPSTMGYYHATYGGIMMKGNMFATTISGSDAGKTHARILHVEGRPTGASEAAAGALVVVCNRASAYPFGTAGTGGWGGAEDAAARIFCYNSAANTSLKGGMRGLNVYARNYSGGQIANIYAGKFDADDRGSGGTSGVSSATIQTLTVAQRVNGVNSTAANVLIVEDNSQGTLQGVTAASTAMIRIRSTQPIASGARHTGILFETSGSGSGWTYALAFQTATGKEGFTAVSAASQGGNIDGYIKIYDVATGQALYLPCYDQAPA